MPWRRPSPWESRGAWCAPSSILARPWPGCWAAWPPGAPRGLSTTALRRAAGVSPSAARDRRPLGAEDGGDLVEPLTGRELEVLARLARGLPNKEIAAELFISPETVKRHAANVYAKLGAPGRRQAVQRAAALGLLLPG